MKIGFIQYDVFKDINKNIKKVENLLIGQDAQLFILPELCDVGYLNSKDTLIKKVQPIERNEMLLFLQRISKNKNCTFIAGLAEKSENILYNTAVVLNNGNIVGTYRKIHLSDYEKTIFSQGKINKIFTIGNIKIGIQICFDLWFPEMAREQIREGADLLCVLANFGGKTTYSIAQTRAIENVRPLILCNRIGKETTLDKEVYFLGQSTIIDKNGLFIEKGVADIETCRIHEIKIAKKMSTSICNDFMFEISKHYTK